MVAAFLPAAAASLGGDRKLEHALVQVIRRELPATWQEYETVDSARGGQVAARATIEGVLAAFVLLGEQERIDPAKRCRRELLRAAYARAYAIRTPGLHGLTVESLLDSIALSGSFRGLTHESSQRDDRWRWSHCSVAIADLSISPVRLDEDRLATARYRAGKILFERGERRPALEIFRKVRSSPVHYANAVPFLVILLDSSAPDVSREVEEHLLDLQKVTDQHALLAFARHKQSKGATRAVARAVCRALELGPLPPESKASRVCHQALGSD